MEKKAKRRVIISDLPAREKNLTTEAMRVIRGGGDGLGGATKPALDLAHTLKYPSDGDDDIYSV